MKRTIIFISLLLITVIYFNCNSSTTGPGNNPIPFHSISGKIDSWNLGNKILKLVYFDGTTILASTNIDSNGNFNLNLPSQLPDSLLISPTYINDSSCVHNVTITPSDVKYLYSVFEVYNDTTLIGSISREYGSYLQTGYIYLEYDYFNKNGSIIGTVNCTNINGIRLNLTYNESFPTGWYFDVMTIDSSSNNYVKLHVNCTEPSGLIWKYTSTSDLKNEGKIINKTSDIIIEKSYFIKP